MKLNNTYYVHKKIRLLCFQLQQISGLKLITNLEDFEEIVFKGNLAYIRIQNNVCFTLNHKLTQDEVNIIDDILVYWRWLEIGQRYKSDIKM